MPNLIGVTKDYFNIIECFNFIRGYSIVYQTQNGNIRHIKKSVESDDQIEEKQGFKTYYTDTQIDKFNDYIVKNILTHDKKDVNNINHNDSDSDDSDDSSDSDSDSDSDSSDDESKSESFENESKDDFESDPYDGLIYFVSSHGDSDNVINDSTGEEYSLTFIFDKFDNENCPYLRHKPKIYFLDCCRGTMTTKRKIDPNSNSNYQNYQNYQNLNGMDESKSNDNSNGYKNGGSMSKNGIKINKKQRMPARTYVKTKDDFQIWATPPGYSAVEAGKKGGYLIQSVTKVFKKNRIFKKEFDTILKQTSKIMTSDMGSSIHGGVNVMRVEKTVDYDIKFQQKKQK